MVSLTWRMVGGPFCVFFPGGLTTIIDIAGKAIRKMFSYMQNELAPYFLKLVLYRPGQAVLGES